MCLVRIGTILAKLAFDLPTSQGGCLFHHPVLCCAHVCLDCAASNIDTEDVYRCLERGITIMKDAISFLLHLRLFVHVIGTGINDGGPVFLALCMLPPLMRHFMSSDLWTKGAILDVN